MCFLELTYNGGSAAGRLVRSSKNVFSDRVCFVECPSDVFRTMYSSHFEFAKYSFGWFDALSPKASNFAKFITEAFWHFMAFLKYETAAVSDP